MALHFKAEASVVTGDACITCGLTRNRSTLGLTCTHNPMKFMGARLQLGVRCALQPRQRRSNQARCARLDGSHPQLEYRICGPPAFSLEELCPLSGARGRICDSEDTKSCSGGQRRPIRDASNARLSQGYLPNASQAVGQHLRSARLQPFLLQQPRHVLQHVPGKEAVWMVERGGERDLVHHHIARFGLGVAS